MSPSTYQQNKSAIYNWRKNHPEKYLAYARKTQKKYDSWKRIAKQFRNIIL